MDSHPDWSGPFTLGILGGGQLGKMLLDETARLGIRTAVLDPAEDAPAYGRTHVFRHGNLMDYDTVLDFGRSVDILTFEIEHINLDALDQLVREGKTVRPSPQLLRIVSNKSAQKAFFVERGIPTLDYLPFEDLAAASADEFGFPVVWKAARGGYDGRGVEIVRGADEAAALPGVPGLFERFLADKREIAVLTARNASGDVVCYEPVEMSFHPTANLVEYLLSPADLDDKTINEATRIARATAEAFELVGIMAVEMFLDADGLWVNEVAPRPHNSGHHTIESHYVSQHEQHLRAILDLPLGSTRALCPAVMVNLLGGDKTGRPRYDGMEAVLALEGAYVHIYGKTQTRPFRKMGHVTLIAETREQALEKARFVQNTLRVNGNE